MHEVAVACEAAEHGWNCQVTVGDDEHATRHAVTVRRSTLGRMEPGAESPDALVQDSFAFLLAREPRAAILRSFDLEVIGSYFADWEHEMRARPTGRHGA